MDVLVTSVPTELLWQNVTSGLNAPNHSRKRQEHAGTMLAEQLTGQGPGTTGVTCHYTHHCAPP